MPAIYVFRKVDDSVTNPVYGAVKFQYPYTEFCIQETAGDDSGMVMYVVTKRSVAEDVLNHCVNKAEWAVMQYQSITDV